MPKFGRASLERYNTLDPKLQYILDIAIQFFDFSIVSGHRNKEDQEAAVVAEKVIFIGRTVNIIQTPPRPWTLLHGILSLVRLIGIILPRLLIYSI